MTSRIVGGQDGAGLHRCADQGRGLLADHLEVGIDGDIGLPLEADVEVLPLAQRQARLVVHAHQRQHPPLAEAVLEEPIEREPAQREQRVTRVDGEGHAPHRPQGRPMTPFGVGVLDVVVDEAEVVAQLHRRGAGQGRAVVAGERVVGEKAEQRAHPLAARTVGAIQAEVIGQHLVQRPRVPAALVEDARHLRLDVGQEARKLGPDVHLGRVPDLLEQACHAAGAGIGGRGIHALHDTPM